MRLESVGFARGDNDCGWRTFAMWLAVVVSIVMVKIDVTERENLLVVRSMINDRHDCGSIASFSATILLARSVYIYTDKCIYPVRIDLLCSIMMMMM